MYLLRSLGNRVLWSCARGSCVGVFCLRSLCSMLDGLMGGFFSRMHLFYVLAIGSNVKVRVLLCLWLER